MKKVLGLLAFVLLLNGCSDGNATVNSFDFTNATALRCSGGDIIYKLNDTEALFFEIPYEQAFINEATPADTSRVFEINATNRVFYRSYNGIVAQANICESIQPPTPTVTEQWTASSGSIEVTTVPVVTANTTLPGGEKILKYRHTIKFREILYNKPDGTTLFKETDPFGTYDTDATVLPFHFDDEVDRCGDLVYNFDGSEAITLLIDPQLIQSSVTPTGQPRTGLISATTNKLTYTLFNGLINANYLCSAATPTTPVPVEVWNGIDGVAGISGIVEVTTVTNGTGFLHEIHLKKVTLQKGISAFLLADDYLLGNLITN